MPSSPPPPPSRLPVFNGVHSPRSASDPFAAYGAAAAAAQRSSPSTSPDLAASARKDHHATSSTLPSIRSLRNAFQSLGHGKKSRQSTSGPRIVTGDEAAKGAPPSSPPTAGGNAGKSGGLFGFHRKVSHPESPPAPRFTAFVQRPSVDHSAPSPPSTSKSAPTSPLPTRAESPLPPIPTPLDSPPPEQHRQSTIAALGPSAASPQIVRKLHRRISSDFARAPSDTPLATLRASEPRSQSLNRRSRRISNRLSASSVFPPHKVGEPSGEDKRGRHVSASASLFSSARPAELKDDLAYRRLSINSQPSPVLNGGSPNLDKGTGWEKSKAQGGGWEPARSGTVAGVGLGVDDFPSQPPSRKYSTPFPSNFEPVPIQHLNPTKPPPVPPTGTAEPLPRPFRPISIAASSADRLSLASSIQRRYGPGSNSQRNSQDGSHYSRSPSVRSSSPANLQNVPRLASGPVGDSRLSTSSFQQAFPNDQQQEVLDIVAPPPPASSDTPLNTGSSPLMRSKSAIDSARAHGETTGQVESGSPVFVIPSDAFADAGEVGRRRSSASLRSLRKASVDGGDPEADEEWKEKKERRRSLRGQKAKSEGWGEQLKQMLAVGDWGQSLLGLGPPVETMPTPSSAEQDDDSTKDLVGVPESPATIAHGVAAREKGSGTNSPLDDLITELGGRRPSDVSSIGRPTASSLFSSRGSAAPTHVEAHPETVAEEHPSDQDLTSYPSPLKNRPPSAPPKFALPTTPIGALSPASGTVELQPPAMALEEDDDEQEILKTEPDPDRTLTLDEMEREISRMEAELALGGRRLDLPASPIPAFGSPTPSLTESMMATPKVDQSQSGTFLSPSSAGPPTPVLPPPSSTLERGNSQSSSLNEITPRTARRWSIVEVERAYERMRGMLGSTRSFCLSEAGENVSVEEAFETALRQAHSSGGSTGLADIEDDLVMLLTPNRLSTPAPGAIPAASPTPARLSGSQLDLSSTSSARVASPLLVVDSTTTAGRTAAPRVSLDSLDSDFTSPPTSPLYSSSAISLKPSIDSLAPPSASSTRAVRRHTFNTAPSSDSLRDVFDEQASERARRRESDSATRRSARRISGRPPNIRTGTATSVISTEGDPTSDGDGWATPSTSPGPGVDRFSLGGARSPAGVRASSRLSSSGALRSGAGRDLQKWLVDDAASGVAPSERAASPASSGGTGRVPSRLSGQRSFDFVKSETETTPKRKSLRPLALAGAAGVGAGGGGGGSGESNTWYPSTPDRQVHRKRSSFGKSTMSSSSTSEGDVASRGGGEDGATTAGGTMNMASIRGMDKLEIFFKYASVKADLDKAVVERDALQDALHETRTTLTDVRAQRDGLETDLKEARAAAKQLKKFLGNDSDSYTEKLDDLVQSRQLWEERARETAAELERAREEADALRREMVEGREREELLERETVMMGARLAAGEAYRASPSPRVPSTVATAASSSPRTAASPRFGGGSPRINGTQSPASASRLPTRQTRSTPPSPNLSRNGSLLASSTRQQGFSSPITPASKLASAYRARTDSTSSSTSSSLNALEQQQRLADVGSPLMGQTMAFGPKSSFGSSVAASPLKARSNGTSFASKMTAPSSTRFRLPSAPPPATQHAMDTNRLSRLSTASSTDDYGDHLPPPVERDWNPSYSGGSGAGDGGGLQGLREDDERFLADLSVGGEGSGEE